MNTIRHVKVETRRRRALSAGVGWNDVTPERRTLSFRHPLEGLAEQPGGAVLVPGHQGHSLLALFADLSRGDDGREGVDPGRVVEQT